MATSAPAHLEPLPGYRLIEPLGTGAYGEVWKCEAPGGLVKAVKLIPASQALDDVADRELEALRLLRTIRHPFLLSIDRVEVAGGSLVVVMELADRSLLDELHDWREAGRPGIPRAELLGWLREAAEALDLLNARHGLQHLDVKPQNLLLVSGHVKVGDFGLVCRVLEGSGPREFGAVSPAYAAPELFHGQISRACDQYSLAIAYHELLTGERPFGARNLRQMVLQHLGGEPSLDGLPAADRPAVARALSKDPERRFASCSEFVRALAEAGCDAAPTAGSGSGGCEPPEAAARRTPPAALASPAPETVEATTGSLTAPACSDGPEALPASSFAHFQFERCLARGPVAELWQARAAHGRECVVQFLYGLHGLDGERRAAALARLAAIRHPDLLEVTAVRSEAGRVVLVLPRLGPTLRQRWRQFRDNGQSGIPRPALLACLKAAAVTLDELRQRLGTLHLGLNPDVLQLAGGCVRMAGYGVAPLLALPAGHPLAAVNPAYAAPELWSNGLGPTCDPFSLACIYQEMLTGCHPFPADGADGRSAQRMLADPDLRPLPPAERPVLARALSVSPGRRFASCLALVQALEAAGERADGPPVVARPNGLVVTGDVEQVVREVIAAVAGGAELHEHGPLRYLLGPGDVLRHRCVAAVPPGALGAALEILAAGRPVQPTEVADDRAVFRAGTAEDAWEEVLGRTGGLEVSVEVVRGSSLPPPLAELRVEIRPSGGIPEWAPRVLRDAGPRLLAELRDALQAHPERRAEDRLAFDRPVTVCPAAGAAPVPARGKDLSPGGMGLYLAERPLGSQMRIFLRPGDGAEALGVPARVVRVRPVADGFEVGTLFLPGRGSVL